MKAIQFDRLGGPEEQSALIRFFRDLVHGGMDEQIWRATLGLSAALTVAALVVLRRRLGAEQVPVPGYPWVPGFFITATLASSVFLIARAPGQAAAGFLTVAAGIPFYFLLRR